MRHEIRWTTQKLRKRLELITPLVHSRIQPTPPFHCLKLVEPVSDPLSLNKSLSDSWFQIEPGDYWLGPSTHFLLSTSFSLPTAENPEDILALYLPIGVAGDFSHPEAMVYLDDEPLAACDRHHQEVMLPARCFDGQRHELLLYGWTGGTRQPETKLMQMNQCWLVQIQEELREFVALSRVTLGIAEQLRSDNPIKHNLINALDDAFNLLDTRSPIGNQFYDSVPTAMESLRVGVHRSGPPLQAAVSAVGHAHIDLAWLWTLGETRRKAERTFTNVLRLMEDDPAFTFTQSQPQLYDFVREDFPALFSEIQKRAAEGRWEPLGGMWVEADCNLTGSESLVRQLLLGRTFFEEHFGPGSESPILWLPDVFGYAANLPQLMRQSGLEYFFTIKLGWNQYNRLPYDTFWWQGIDGTRVLTHFSPTKQPGSSMVSTYNSDASPGQIMSTWTNFQQKDLGMPGAPPPLLMSYGYGDGGGGPTREMLENIRLLDEFPAAPRVRYSKAIDFFRDLEAAAGDRIPTWQGELYLEYHRGTYTTQSRIKRANRKSEVRLHDAEFLNAIAAITSDSYDYPDAELVAAWKVHCLNQFHDILPGSSIGKVYEEANEQHRQLSVEVGALRDIALEKISEKVGSGSPVLLVNPSPFEQSGPVLIPNKYESGIDSGWIDDFQHQPVDGGYLVAAGALPPYSITPLVPGRNRVQLIPSSDEVSASKNHLENNHLRVTLNDNGDIVSIFDKHNVRELLPDGEIANAFQLFEDRPLVPDAWDIDIFYDDKVWLAEPASSVVVVENGPLRAAIEVKRKLFSSDLVQRISLCHESPVLVFDTEIDWKERQTLLKVAFPLDVLSPVASYEIQWGHVQRPTHTNTSWDWARFESCAQKWVDLSEGGFGVTLINDCKHGHDIHGNVIRLSLLRGTTDPDPQADLGHHEFSYALLPHSGPLSESTVSAAYTFNDPPFSYTNKRYEPTGEYTTPFWAGTPFIRCSSENAVVETIKRAEDGNGIIIRLYESLRKRGRVRLDSILPLESVWRTNLLESNIEQIETDGQCFDLHLGPFEIITVRLVPAGPEG